MSRRMLSEPDLDREGEVVPVFYGNKNFQKLKKHPMRSPNAAEKGTELFEKDKTFRGKTKRKARSVGPSRKDLGEC